MKILLSTGVGYLTHTLPEVETMALDLGYDGVEVVMPPRHMDANEVSKLRDTSYSELTHAYSVHAPGDIYDQPRFRAALNDACGIAQMIEAKIVVIHPAPREHGGRKNVTEAMIYIQQKQRETNLTIVYEVLVDPNTVEESRREWFKRRQAYQTLPQWVSDIKKYDLAACLDTAHIGTWLVDPTTLLEPLGNNLQHVHFGDYDADKKVEHLVPGTGSVALTSFLKALANTHPDITLTVELQPPTTVQAVENVARQSIEFIKNALYITK